MYFLFGLITTMAALVSGRKFNGGGGGGSTDPNVNFIDDPGSVAGIDFSRGVPGPDGSICVQRKKYVDKTEKDQLKECFVQNVTQCYYTYITEYTDGVQEKCEDFYWKTCKIVFKERVFNATSRSCKRPLIKQCDDGGAPGNEPEIVCETFFETECNTTAVVPSPDTEPLDVTFCDKIPRKICAPDNCRVVEGPEECQEQTDESTIEHPVELCDLQPQKHCSQEKISVPRLIPEQKCRQVEKEICHTQMINPHDIKKPVFIKYCTRQSNLAQQQQRSAKAAYLPPGPPPPSELPTYSAAASPPAPTRGANSNTFRPINIRQKREPEGTSVSGELSGLYEEDDDAVIYVAAPVIKRRGRSLTDRTGSQMRRSTGQKATGPGIFDPLALTYN